MSPARYTSCLAVESLIRGTLSPITEHSCQPFEGALDPMGFPLVPLYQGGERRAVDVCWELHHGPIPEGQFVEHRCGNLECVDHRHLRLAGEATLSEWSAFEI